MICRIEVSRPPGVLSVIRMRLAFWRLAWLMPLTMYSASTGSISSLMRSCTTFCGAFESTAGAEADAKAGMLGEARRNDPAAAHTAARKMQSRREAISNGYYSKNQTLEVAAGEGVRKQTTTRGRR